MFDRQKRQNIVTPGLDGSFMRKQAAHIVHSRTRSKSQSANHRAPAQGYVTQVGVSAQSGESASDYSRRTSRQSYAQERARAHRRKYLRLAAIVGVVTLCVALVVGVFVFFHASDSKLVLNPSNAKEALVAPEANKPYYVLCAAELGSGVKAGGYDTDAYLLVRFDEAARSIIFVSIPANVEVRLSDGNNHPLYDARKLGGDAELITSVSSLVGVDIAHYVFANAEGISRIVDALGGVTINLREEVDDPRAGTLVLPAGDITLNGKQALVLLRASNFAGGFETLSNNRIDFMLALANKSLAENTLSFAAFVGNLGSYTSMDITSAQLIALGDVFRPLDDDTIYRGIMAGHESTNTGLFVYGDGEWEQLIEAIKAGVNPGELDSAATSVNPASITVEVRNGSGATGAAAKMATILEDVGYKIEGVGNSNDGTTYPETLVIYKDDSYLGAAKSIVQDLHSGRVVNGGDFYSFDTNVLIILGRDWIPLER